MIERPAFGDIVAERHVVGVEAVVESNVALRLQPVPLQDVIPADIRTEKRDRLAVDLDIAEIADRVGDIHLLPGDTAGKDAVKEWMALEDELIWLQAALAHANAVEKISVVLEDSPVVDDVVLHQVAQIDNEV